MMFAGSQVGEEHGKGQQAGRHQVLRPQLHWPHTECCECLFGLTTFKQNPHVLLYFCR